MGRYIGSLATILILSLALLVGFSCSALAAQAVLAWNASTDSSVIGYKVYFGTQTGDYQTPIDVGDTTSYTVTGLSASQTYYFAVTAYSNSAESPYSQELTCDFITADASSNGQITPAGETAVASGGSQTYSIVPNAGYQIGTVFVDGQQVTPASTYTFSNVSGCHTIAASFVPVTTTTTGGTTTGGTTSGGSTSGGSQTTYSISATFQGSGSISPSGIIGVSSGSSWQFTITPDTGYKISNVVVDGTSVGAVSSYSFSNVSANHSIEATFAAKQCSISASVQGSGGTISPSGTNAYSAGTNVSYSMIPAAGYKLAGVIVDGSEVASAQLQSSASPAAAGASTGTTSYTFTDVEGNHTISAVFFPDSQFVVDPGPDQKVQSGSTVTLSGSNSTGSLTNPITSYSWTQVSGPTVSLLNPSSAQCTFTTQNIASTAPLVFNLTVTNSQGQSRSALCLVNVTTNGAGPSVKTGADQTVSAYSNVTLDGSSSSDSYGTIISYKWTQIAGPAVSILNGDTSVASFVAPDAGTNGATLVFELTVQDQYGLEARGQWTVNVESDYQPPVANAGADITAAPSTTVTLNGLGSKDPTGSSDTYRWTQISGVPVTLSDPSSPTPSFTAPVSTSAQASQLVFKLTVANSQDLLSSTDKCAVVVQNANSDLPSLSPKWSFSGGSAQINQ